MSLFWYINVICQRHVMIHDFRGFSLIFFFRLSLRLLTYVRKERHTRSTLPRCGNQINYHFLVDEFG